MDSIAISAIITAVATVVYTVGTYLLWSEAIKNSKAIKEQIEINSRTVRAATYAEIIRSHRDLFLNLLSNPDFRAHLPKTNGQNDNELIEAFTGTLLINHASQLHYQYLAGTIEPNCWSDYLTDIADLFRWPVVVKRREKVKQCHSQEFRQVISEITTAEKYYDTLL
jgi:hypothetical protein